MNLNKLATDLSCMGYGWLLGYLFSQMLFGQPQPLFTAIAAIAAYFISIRYLSEGYKA